MRFVPTAFFLACFLQTSGIWAEGLFSFPNGRKAGSVDHVTSQLKVGGDILEMREGKLERLKMGGMGTLDYREMTLEVGGKPSDRIRSIRHYDQADADIRVGRDALKTALRSGLFIAAATDAKTSILFSPQEPLSADELDVIDILGNSLLLDQLLPAGPVAVGHTWKPESALLAMLLALDSVGQNNVKCEVVEVTDTVARFQITGSLSGTIYGAATQIQLKAKYRYDRRSKRIDWFAMSMKEEREVGLIAEGFDIVAQVQVRIVPEQGNAGFDQKKLDQWVLEPNDTVVALAYESADSAWRLTHSRDWYVIHSTPDLAIFRLIDQGRRVAECRISALPDVPREKLPTLESFQNDVRNTLGDAFDHFVSASQWANEAKYRVYRVAVSGQAQSDAKLGKVKVPIEWRYYLVADDYGRRVAFVVTVEEELLKQLGDADRELVEAFRFKKTEEE